MSDELANLISSLSLEEQAMLLEQAKRCISIGPTALEEWPADIKQQLDIANSMERDKAMQQVAAFYIKAECQASNPDYSGVQDPVVVRCGSHHKIIRRQDLRRAGQNSWDPEDASDDVLTVLANTCQYCIDLVPAPATPSVAACILLALECFLPKDMGGKKVPYITQWDIMCEDPDYKDENVLELLDTADHFAVHPLFNVIIDQLVHKPLYYKQQTAEQILHRYDHRLVTRAICQALQRRCDSVFEADDIMRIVEANAITLVLCDYRYLAKEDTDLDEEFHDIVGESHLLAHANGCIIVNWEKQLSNPPQWLEAVEKVVIENTTKKQKEGKSEATFLPQHQFTVLNFPVDVLVDVCPGHPGDWGGRSLAGYGLWHVSADGLKGNLVDCVMFENSSKWEMKSERKSYVSVVMSALDESSAKRIHTPSHLTEMHHVNGEEEQLDDISVSVSGFSKDRMSVGDRSE